MSKAAPKLTNGMKNTKNTNPGGGGGLSMVLIGFQFIIDNN